MFLRKSENVKKKLYSGLRMKLTPSPKRIISLITMQPQLRTYASFCINNAKRRL